MLSIFSLDRLRRCPPGPLPQRNNLVRLNNFVLLLLVVDDFETKNLWISCRLTNKDTILDNLFVELRILHDVLDRRDRLLEQVDAQLLNLRPRDRSERIDVDVQLVNLDRRVHIR